ncbi:hypothetical protein ACTA71_000170 [Dictyostelium dimigraforme]
MDIINLIIISIRNTQQLLTNNNNDNNPKTIVNCSNDNKKSTCKYSPRDCRNTNGCSVLKDESCVHEPIDNCITCGKRQQIYVNQLDVDDEKLFRYTINNRNDVNDGIGINSKSGYSRAIHQEFFKPNSSSSSSSSISKSLIWRKLNYH